jgi:hypothetical protein
MNAIVILTFNPCNSIAILLFVTCNSSIDICKDDTTRVNIIVITCQLRDNYNTTYSSSDVYFTAERNHDIVRLNEIMTIVNETTSILQHVVSADDHRNNIYCETKDQYIATKKIQK